MLVKIAYRGLTQYKLRTFLTVLGLAVAVIGITGYGIASASLQSSIKKSIGMSNRPDGRILVRDAVWNDSYAAELEDYEVIYRYLTMVNIGGKTERMIVSGVDMRAIENEKSLSQIFLTKGQLPKFGEVLVERSAAKSLGIKIGDVLPINIPRENGSTTQLRMKISGLAVSLNKLGYVFSSSISVWMDIEDLHSLIGSPLFSEILAVGGEEAIINAAHRMADSGVFVEKVSFETNEDRQDVLKVMGVISSVIAGIALLIGGVLTATTVQTAVSSERKNIALMKIIGGRGTHLFLLYLTQIVMLALLSAGLGIVLSLVGGWFILDFIADPFNLPLTDYVVPPDSIVWGVLIPLITALIFSIPVLRSVLKVPPMTFFGRDEEGGRKFKLHRWTLLSISWGNLFRNRRRLLLNLLLFSLSIMMVVSIQSLGDSYVQKIDEFIDSFPADITVFSSTPVNQTVMQNTVQNFFSEKYSDQLKELTSLWWSQVNVNVSGEPSTNLIGIDPGATAFSSLNIIEGRWLDKSDVGRPHVVITEKFIQEHFKGVTPSNITVQTFSKNISLVVIGVTDDFTNDGRMMYLDLNAMQGFLDGLGLVNGMYITLSDPSLGQEVGEELAEWKEVQNHGWTVTSMEYWREFNLRSGRFFTLFITALASIGVVVAVIGGANSHLMSVIHREREIGIIKLIGGHPLWIFLSILTEGILQSVVSTLIGLSIARFLVIPAILSALAAQIIEFNIVFGIKHIVTGFALTLSATAIGTIYPAIKASKTSALNALRYD